MCSQLSSPIRTAGEVDSKSLKRLHLCLIPFKEIVHPKMKNLSSFTHPQAVPNLFLSFSCWVKKIFWRMLLTKQLTSTEYLLLCSAEERNSYRFKTSGVWVNDDRIFTTPELRLFVKKGNTVDLILQITPFTTDKEFNTTKSASL